MLRPFLCKTSTEWLSFRTYYPSSCCTVTADCAECSIPGDCDALYPDCGTLMDCVDGSCCTDGIPEGDCPEMC